MIITLQLYLPATYFLWLKRTVVHLKMVWVDHLIVLARLFLIKKYPKMNVIVGNWLQIDYLISSMLEGNRFPMYNRECIMQEHLIIRIIRGFLSEGMISQHLHSIFDNVGDQHFSFRVGWLSIRLKYVCFYNFDKTLGIWQNDSELYVLKFIWSFYTKIVWDSLL